MTNLTKPSQEKVLLIPSGKDGVSISFNLTEVERIENRVDEVKRSNPLTFPDLVVDFNIGMAKLGSMIGQVDYELDAAKQALKMAESIARLDKAEAAIKERNLKSSSDLREAIVDLDPDVIQLRDRVALLKSVSVFLQNKYSTLERSYFTAKTVCDLQNVPMGVNFGGKK